MHTNSLYVCNDVCNIHISLCVNAEISELQSLETLNVASNRLITLPASVGKMTRLRHLYVTHNKISHLPDGMA